METKESVLEKRIKKSELRAAGVFDYEYLTRNRQGLLPCTITEDGEDVIWKFNVEDMHPLSELKSEELEYRYRFLQNFRKLEEIWQNYELPLEEENIYYDCNYMPYLALRDIRQTGMSEDAFFEEYQLLAAGVLSRKYSYMQVKESGLEILRKDKGVSFVLQSESLEELHRQIREKAEELYEINKYKKIRLDKKGYQLQKRITAGVFVLLAVLLIYTGYQTFVVMPRNKAVIRASRAYTVQNYVDCIDNLKKIEPDQMDTYTKYILAVSYARSEALEKEELANVLDKISIYSNEVELEYWIAVGRSDFEKAENNAKALSDDKLLIYAYMKELNYLEGNVTMDGEEKQSRMNELGNAITEIGKKYTEED